MEKLRNRIQTSASLEGIVQSIRRHLSRAKILEERLNLSLDPLGNRLRTVRETAISESDSDTCVPHTMRLGFENVTAGRLQVAGGQPYEMSGITPTRCLIRQCTPYTVWC